MHIASEADIQISEDGFVRVAGVPLGRIQGDCIIILDHDRRRVQTRGGEKEIAIPMALLQLVMFERGDR